MAHLVRIKVFDRRWPSKGLRIYRLSGKVSFRMQQISGCCASGQYQSGQDGLQVQGQLLHHLSMWNKLKWIFKKWAHLDKDEQKTISNNLLPQCLAMQGYLGFGSRVRTVKVKAVSMQEISLAPQTIFFVSCRWRISSVGHHWMSSMCSVQADLVASTR